LDGQKRFEDCGHLKRTIENFPRHLVKCRTIGRTVGRSQVAPGFIREEKRPGSGVEDPNRPFDNQTVEFLTANAVGKGLADSLQELEDAALLGLQIRQTPLKPSNDARQANH
jgi:hypothetical protein